MFTSTVWINRIKAVAFGLGLGLAFHTAGNWWKIFSDHVPECAQPNCVADFAAIYTGAKLIWENPNSLYDPTEQLARQQQIAPTERALPFVYPPVTAAALSPLAWFSFSHAFLFMTLVSIFLVVQSLRLLVRHLNLTKDQSQWLMIFALCNFGVQAVVFFGQTSAFILFMLTQHVLAQKQQKRLTGGVWAGMLCLKPQFLTIPCIALLVRRRWQELFTAGLITSLLVGAAFLWIGSGATTKYFHLIQEMTIDSDWTNPLGSMHNLRALSIYWLPANWQAPVWWAGCGLVIASMIVFNMRAHNRADGFAATWIVNILALLIVIPHLFTHDLTLLILPCALFLSRFKETVPISVGLGLVILAALPTLNYVLPTIMASALVILYTLSVAFGWARFAQSRFAI